MINMTQPVSTAAIYDSEARDREEDNVVTDVTRPVRSPREIQQHKKWKQNLRIELIREHYQAQEKNTDTRKPVLLQMLNLKQDRS